MPPFSRPGSRQANGPPREPESSGLQGSRWSNAKKAPSATWSRLKPVVRDELTAYGFPSKGETKLNDFRNQEALFDEIFKRYMAYMNHTRGKDPEIELAKLSLEPNKKLSRITMAKLSSTSAPQWDAVPAAASAASTRLDPSPELVLIYTAMRKLREGLVASSRADNFAKTTYLFLIRQTVLARQWEAYTPAIAQLISHVHPKTPLDETELTEITAFRILDLACRQNNLQAAMALRRKSGWRPRSKVKLDSSDTIHIVDEVLQALLHDEWLRFWRAKRYAVAQFRMIMEFAEENVRIHALKCLSRSYFEAEKDFVEKSAGRNWAQLVDEGVGWQLVVTDGEDWSESKETIVIRKAKPK